MASRLPSDGKFKKALQITSENGDVKQVVHHSPDWTGADDKKIRQKIDEVKKDAPVPVAKVLDEMRSMFE